MINDAMDGRDLIVSLQSLKSKESSEQIENRNISPIRNRKKKKL